MKKKAIKRVLFSVMRRRLVCYKATDVSKERAASFFRAEDESLLSG